MMVDYRYCKTCKHWEKSENDDPCFDCLDHAYIEHSVKPLHYEEDEESVKRSEKDIGDVRS